MSTTLKEQLQSLCVTHSIWVCSPNCLPSESRTHLFQIIGCLSISSGRVGALYIKPWRKENHTRKMHRMKGDDDKVKRARLPITPTLWHTVQSTDRKKGFQGSSPRNMPLMSSLASTTVLCICGSMVPKPPFDRGTMIVGQAMQVQVSREPLEWAKREFWTSCLNCKRMHECNIQQEVVYQAVAALLQLQTN